MKEFVLLLLLILPAVLCNDANCAHLKFLNMSTTPLKNLEGRWWGRYVLKESKARGVGETYYKINCRCHLYGIINDDSTFLTETNKTQSKNILEEMSLSQTSVVEVKDGMLWNSEIFGGLINKYGLLILEPKNYMVTYMCTEDQEASVIWTSEMTSIENATLAAIEEVLKHNKLSLDDYEITPLSTCPPASSLS